MLIQPPRADNTVAPGNLPAYEKLGFWLQYKRNGSYTIIDVRADGKIHIENRHGQPHKLWKLTNAHQLEEFCKKLPVGIYCAELLDFKVKRGPKDTLYFHDVLAFGNKPLIGHTYQQRYGILTCALMKHPMANQQPQQEMGHTVIRPHVWLAKNFTGAFAEIFSLLTAPEDEGVVLKNPKHALSFKNNPGWSFKCRRPIRTSPIDD